MSSASRALAETALPLRSARTDLSGAIVPEAHAISSVRSALAELVPANTTSTAITAKTTNCITLYPSFTQTVREGQSNWAKRDPGIASN
jgi:hypothetical protein